MELLRKIYRKEVRPDFDYFFLIGIVLCFTLLRLPSLIEPSWYGDEGIYQVVGKALHSGRALYVEIWDHKPPLLYIYYALVNGDLFLIKLLSLLFGIGAVVVLFFVARMLFQNKRLPVYSAIAIFAVVFGLPILEGNIANAENFMLFPILLALFLILKMKNNSPVYIPIFAGLLLSAAFLTKIVAVFDLFAFLFILFLFRFHKKNLSEIYRYFYLKPKKIFTVFKQEIIITLSFLSPVVFVSLFFLSQGAFQEYFTTVFLQNVGYVEYKNNFSVDLYFVSFSIPQGFLFLKTLFVIGGLSVIWFIRKHISPLSMVLFIWLLFSFFNMFFSGREYLHYVLVILPVASLLFGAIFIPTSRNLKITYCVLFAITVGVIYYNFGYYKRNISYYNNYIEFVTDKKSVEQYQSFFDRITPRDYAVARFISENTKDADEIFLITESAQIYYLADKLPPGKYIVSYHISSDEKIAETMRAIDHKKPKFIISTKEDDFTQRFIQGYTLTYILMNVKIYERI